MDIIEVGKPWGKKINLIQNMTLSEIRKTLELLINTKNNSNSILNSAAINLGLNIITLLKKTEN